MTRYVTADLDNLGVAENTDMKARRLLADGRLSVLKVDRDRNHIFAVCKGDHGTYRLGFNGGALEWSCDCPAYGECSHLAALKLVTAPFAE